MSQLECPSSVYVCAIRIAALGTDGVPLPGTGNLYTNDAMVEISAEPVFGTADEFEQKNGCGDICVAVTALPPLKGWNLTMTLCRPDPEIFAMLTNGNTLSDAGNVVGYQFPLIGSSDTDNNGASIEAWSKAWIDGHQADNDPWIRWVFPRTKWNHGPMTLNNGILVPTLNGIAEQNTNWFDGPANDWDFDSGSAIQYARDDALPATTCGSTSLIAS